jgi:hypothetical protein
MSHGRKIPGIIKKINKALGKFIYPKYYKHSNKCYNLACFWTIRPSGAASIEIFFKMNFINTKVRK